MKGIILAGGSGSRLDPLTRVTNKHLLPVYDRPMIFNPINTLAEAGIQDIQMVIGGNGVGDIVKICGSGSDFGLTLSYVHQDKPGGIAQALKYTKRFANGEPIVVILGDNIFEDNIKKYVEDFQKNPDMCNLFLTENDQPERFGVAELDANGSVISIEEKPKKPKSNYIVTGLYFYPSNIYDAIGWVEENIGYSWRNELEITDVNNYYIQRNQCRAHKLKGFWSDTGTFPTLLRAANFLARKG
ncbi:MAG: NTP transferase domain-containing protein [Candidatus Thorarchaeota archaeon]|nr:NTP transferase domain-containing protein [Candidatus Thorarchaeota archaeon]